MTVHKQGIWPDFNLWAMLLLLQKLNDQPASPRMYAVAACHIMLINVNC